MKERIHEYRSDDITVQYTMQRCIHAAECVRGLPHVFDPKARPWIDPTRADADAIADTIMRCPTGALHFERRDGGATEPTPTENTVTIVPNGPLYIRGDIAVTGLDGGAIIRDTRVALCRCGASHNKPFCDNSHIAAAFSDDATGPADTTNGGTTGGLLTITALPNGPLRVKGAAEAQGADGVIRYRGEDTAFCRCGGSQHKPFCDGTHKKIGFKDRESEQG